MRLSVSELFSTLRASYWFIPLAVTLAAAALAVLMLLLDEQVRVEPWPFLRWVYPNSPEGARALLSAIIGSMITATSVTFSVTVVALTVAAQHFGPRVLHNFVRQTSSQVVLGTFIGTFVYAVLVLGAVGDTGSGSGVPRIASIGAVVLVVISVGALIFYVHKISSSLRIGHIAREVASDFTSSIRRTHCEPERSDRENRTTGEPPEEACPIPAKETGYVQRIDYVALVALASERDACIWIRREPGAFVVRGAPFALLHPPTAFDEDLSRAFTQACVVGPDRTNWQDPEFALKQLVEVALRALSPGVNEPFTAVTCIDRLAEGLAAAASAPRPQTAWAGADGRLRIFTQSASFETLLRAAFDPIRIFAGPNPGIYTRLLESLGELALVSVREEDRAALCEMADAVRVQADTTLTQQRDRSYVAARASRLLDQLDGGPAAGRRR